MTQADVDNEYELWRQLREALFDADRIKTREWETRDPNQQTSGVRVLRAIEAWATAAARLQKEESK